MIEPAALIASADEIDNRLGPIPGRSSDRIARELRAAAELIIELRAATNGQSLLPQGREADHG